MQIYQYLNKIKAGETINFDSFRRLLIKHHFDEGVLLDIFETKKTSSLSYQLKVLDQKQFDQLFLDFPEQNITDRVSAAKAGDSHKHGVSQAMVILWSAHSNHPVVVLNANDNINSPVPLSKHLLIIENQENFVQKQRTLDFLQQQFAGFNTGELDIALGAGNSISNRLNKQFFSQYQQIDCLLDLDMGGLEIFKNLLNLTEHKNLNFLLPACADNLLKQSKIPLQEKHVVILRQYHKEYPLLRPVIELIGKHQKMMEQELYL